MVDLINKLDFKKEISDSSYQTKLPQNIQAIRVFLTDSHIILEPNSRSLPINTRIIVDRSNNSLNQEPLSQPNQYVLDNSSAQLFSAFLGIITFKSYNFLILVDRCTHHSLNPLYCDFFQVASTVFVPVESLNYQIQEIVEYIANLRELLGKGFYFTYEECQLDREKFMWNSNLLKPLYQYNIKQWDIMLIQGFVDSFQVYQDGKRIQVALVARRSKKAPGTRQYQTGVQKDGSVANFVETEQIVSVANIKTSFKQIRGSVPVFWRQKGMLMKQLELFGTDQENQQALERHFNCSINAYERVIAINLMNKDKSTEHDLIQAYELGIQQMNSDRLKYMYYNFDEQTKGMDFQIINKHINMLAPVIKNLQFDAEDLITHQKYLKQRGIVRTNCLACLDRTNVYQQRIGLLHLDFQLQSMGIHLEKVMGQNVLELNDADPQKQVNPLILMFKTLWADHGDQISLLYSGTGSIHTNFDRIGQQSFFQILGSGMVPLSRFYRNNFSEHIRQESIIHLLGLNQQEVNTLEIPEQDDINNQLPFTRLLITDLNKAGYYNLYFKSYEIQPELSRAIIYAYSDDKVIAITSYRNKAEKYYEDVENIKNVEKIIHSPIKLKKIESKLSFITELGNINLLQLTQQKYEVQPFLEQQLLSILLQMALSIKKYSVVNLYLNGLTTQSVWLSSANKGCNLYFDTVTTQPTNSVGYPTAIKPDYMDPIIMQKLQQQEKALEQQEDIYNTTDLMVDKNIITDQEIQQAQVWIIGRLIYSTLMYPQPTQTNSLELMLPHLQGLSENGQFVNLCKILRRIFREDYLTSIINVDTLITELQSMKVQDFQLNITNELKDVKQGNYTSEELKQQVDLCKNFKQHIQGTKALEILKSQLTEVSLEEQISITYDAAYFQYLKGSTNECLGSIEELFQLFDNNERDITVLRTAIIESNILLLRCYLIQEQKVLDLSQLRNIMSGQDYVKHPLVSNIYLALSQIAMDEDEQLEFAIKAQEHLMLNKICNDHFKAMIHSQLIKLYLRKGQTLVALKYIMNLLQGIGSAETIERLHLLIYLSKTEEMSNDDKKAQNYLEQAYKLSLKIYKDDKHQKVQDIREQLLKYKQI